MKFDKEKKFEKAIELYDMAIDLNPNLEPAVFNKALCLHNLGHFEEAIKFHDEAINLCLSLLEPCEKASFHKGITLFELGRYEEAIELYDRAIALRPSHYEYFHSKGMVLTS